MDVRNRYTETLYCAAATVIADGPYASPERRRPRVAVVQPK